MVSRLLVCYKKLHLKGWSFLLNRGKVIVLVPYFQT
jgi:hypothetical protein